MIPTTKPTTDFHRQVVAHSRHTKKSNLPKCKLLSWWLDQESNQGHEDFQSSALPTELSRRSSGDRIWTCDLRVMSPTSFRAALPRVIYISYYAKVMNYIHQMGGEGFEPSKAVPADLQSVPFGHSGIHPYKIKLTIIPISATSRYIVNKEPTVGVEPTTCWLQISCSAIEPCRHINGTYRARTCDPLLVRQMLSQLS